MPAGVEVATEVSYGVAAKQILAALRRLHADGVVMATHGRTGLAHLLHGSVAEAILAGSHVPVFLVHAKPAQTQAFPFDASALRVLVPLDGSDLSEAALPLALAYLTGQDGGSLGLVTAVAEPDHVQYDEMDECWPIWINRRRRSPAAPAITDNESRSWRASSHEVSN